MSWPAKHPGPWRCEFDEDCPATTDWPILDANGEPVVVTDSGFYPPDPETARAIVDAMNNEDSWRKAYIKARTERNAFLHERDQLRDLVGRLAQRIQFARLSDPNPGGEDPLLREAAAVCKKAREEK